MTSRRKRAYTGTGPSRTAGAVGGEELDRGIDADRHEHAARDGVEERLGDLRGPAGASIRAS